MDESPTVTGSEHLGEELLDRAVDAPEGLGEPARRHLELCAPCRAELERRRTVARLVAELGEHYRVQAPPEWPAASAVEALAREPERGPGWLRRLGESLGIRGRSVATAVAAAVGLFLAAAVVFVAVRSHRSPGPAAPVAAAVADGGQAATPPRVPGPPTGPGPSTTAVRPAPHPAPGSSSVVAVVPGRDVSYVMMSVPYQGGTAAVIWLNALPASGG